MPLLNKNLNRNNAIVTRTFLFILFILKHYLFNIICCIARQALDCGSTLEIWLCMEEDNVQEVKSESILDFIVNNCLHFIKLYGSFNRNSQLESKVVFS